MKKIFAVISILVLSLSLSACNFSSETNEKYLKHSASSLNKYVTAININLISIFSGYNKKEEAVEASYVIEIGACEGSLTKEQAAEALNCESFSRSYEVKTANKTYVYYAFKLVATNKIKYNGKNFGFFYISDDYWLINNKWINSVRKNVLERTTKIFEETDSPYSIDQKSARFRFFLVQDSGFSSKGAKKISKSVNDGAERSALMWEATQDGYDFTFLNLKKSTMAAGWYVIAIGAGIIVVLVLLLLGKKGKGNGGKAYEQPFEENFGQSPQTPRELGGTGQSIQADVFDEQISMEEYIGANSEEEDG